MQNGNQTEPYLIDVGQDREKLAMRRAVSLYLVLQPLLLDLGLSGANWWVILEVPISVILGDAKAVGEIDALFGSLAVGVPDWPPKMEHLAAIEAKASYLYIHKKSGNVSLAATRSWKKNRAKATKNQLPRLVSLGFNRIEVSPN
ncbi:MAG: hypothetical protein HYR80_07980 [Nitrospirae bacterium]|nr:hypothetical protein [Nitrospirota bacterium]